MATKKISWADPSKYIDRIYVEESCIDLEYTREILARSGLSYELVKERQRPNDLDLDYVNNLTRGKRDLFLCMNRGAFFKPCPATREYRCCEYHVLNTGTNCPIDCSYCILQAYLNTPWLTFYVNIDRMFAELEEELEKKESGRFYRIGTGEFTDSLAIDRLTRLSSRLVEYMAGKSNGVLELKTKSASISNLEKLDHRGRTVIAWSLNSPQIMQAEEIRSATLTERLEAARQCAEWGYKLAFHFDPIIHHDGWREGYAKTIEMLYDTVDPGSICWISLGALRYLPHLKEIGTRRFPGSKIYFHEFIEGLDGKSRYFRPERVEMYSWIYEKLKTRAAASTCIYFCMESDEIWRQVTGFVPQDFGGLPTMLDKSVSGM